MLELVCGDCSPLYKKLIEKQLINDEFSSEYFNGPGYSVVFFDGESKDPKAVAAEIENEISRLIQKGIDSDLFEAVKKSAWGDQVRRFESLENIVADMIDSAFYNDDIFSSGEIIKSISEQDIIDRLKSLKPENAVLSVINRKD